jgi:hypothetical protein
MDAEETLAFLRARNQVEIPCKSGTTYTLILPDVMRFLAHGTVPYGAVKKIYNNDGTAKPADQLSEEESRAAAAEMYDLYDAIIAEAIIKIEGQEVEMTAEAVRFIPPGDRRELIEHIERERTLPKVASQPPESSETSPPPKQEEPSPESNGTMVGIQPQPSSR